MKKEKMTSNLKLTIFNKGGATWYCDYYFYNGMSYEQGTTKASGYGYDKESSAASEALNRFKFLYQFKNGLKWDGAEHVNTKQNKRIYGIYKDKSISYGIGLSSVLNCINAFSNVKIKQIFYGKYETSLQLEIKNTKKQLQKEIEKAKKIIANKKAEKYEKKRAKETIEKIKKLFEIEAEA